MYASILACAMVVTVIGLSALAMVRIQRQGIAGTHDMMQAALNAQAAVERGLFLIANDANWRTTYSSGVWLASKSLANGIYTLEGIDPDDGNLGDEDTDPVNLIGTGVVGDARHKTKVTLVARRPPLGCLEASLQAGDDLIFDKTIVSGSQIVSTNNNCLASLSTINPNVEAVNSISGDLYLGYQWAGVDPRSMPDSSALDYYVNNGTAISFGAIPQRSGRTTIEKVAIGPGANPYGTTNAQGIYVIDCLGQNITIKNSRIIGTLVLIDAGKDSRVEGSVNWQPAISNYPSLLVQGSMNFAFTTDDLSELALLTNFNPPGLLGALASTLGFVLDLLTLDTYPSYIQGLVYVSEDVTTSNAVTFSGSLIVGNAFDASGTLNISYRKTHFNNPPPGFTEPLRMIIADGSWRQVVN